MREGMAPYRPIDVDNLRATYKSSHVVESICGEIEFLRAALTEAVEILWDVDINKLPKNWETSPLADFVAHAPVAWHLESKAKDQSETTEGEDS